MSTLNRRQLLQGAVAGALLPVVPACGAPAAGAPTPAFPGARPAPIGPFDEDSTAEDVTAGMDLSGRNALVTGVTSGIGLETMRVLALRGAHVLGTGRTLEKAQRACASVQGPTTPLALELEDWDAIVACAEEVRRMGPPLDMLICNAGLMGLAEREQVRGIEKHFAVNHLGHFILVNRLMDRVQAAPAGRVVVVGSRAYRSAAPEGIEFDNLAGDRDYDPQRAYGQSKVANYLFVRELARRLRESTATANGLHPGVILTDIVRHLPAWQRAGARLVGWTFMKSIPQGAATTCYVATSALLAGVSGYFFQNCNPVKPSGHMEDDAQAARLWEVSAELTRGYLG